MQNKNKFTPLFIGTLLFLVVLIIIISINRNGVSQNNEKSQVTIGLSLPLTGGVSILGEPAREAAELALADIDSTTRHSYKLVFEDDAFDPKQAATNAQKLININNATALISFGSGTGNAVRPIAESSKVPHFSLASDPTVAEGEYNYIHWAPAFIEGQKLVDEIVKRGYESVAIVDTNHPGTRAVSEAIRQALAKTDVTIVADEMTQIGEKDFRTIINKITKTKPEIIVLEQFSPEIEIMTKQMRTLSVNIPITSVETFEWSNEPTLYEGMWFVSYDLPNDFATHFKKSTGREAMAGSSYVYDLVHLIISMQEESDKPLSGAELQQKIKALGGYESPVYGKIEIDEKGFFITDAVIKIMQNGEAVRID